MRSPVTSKVGTFLIFLYSDFVAFAFFALAFVLLGARGAGKEDQ